MTEKGKPSQAQLESSILESTIQDASILDEMLKAHEGFLYRATRVGIPGLAPISDLLLPPGSRALHGEEPCIIRAHLSDGQKDSEVLVIVKYERMLDCKYVVGRKSNWGLVDRSQLKPWQPKRPKCI